MKPRSVLLLPSRELSACFFAAIQRDTRGVELSDSDRLNFFPASPLVSVTYVADGELRLVPRGNGLEAARSALRLPRLFVMPPQTVPTVSWSSGPICAITVGVYPDAWTNLSCRLDLPGLLQNAYRSRSDARTGWERFCAAVSPAWDAVRLRSVLPEWTGAARLSDWSRALIARAALTGAGRSVRASQRRLKRWSGQTRQSLDFYAAFDRLHHLSTQRKDLPLADLALLAGYSDQSHMGRTVRRATGFSPAMLNRLIESEEAFWCYRLLGERF